MFPNFPFRFEQDVLNRARERNLLVSGDRILVGVSGGPDSVGLLTWLCACQVLVEGIVLGVVHVHHGLRGAEADEDAVFVKRLSRTLNLPYFQKSVPVMEQFRAQKGESLQAIARRERYRTFVQVAKEFHASKVALGHTQDDQAETVLMWMLRGAGATGLAGMAAHRMPWFIRPFLSVRRPHVLAYLAQKGVDFRTDSSNAKPCYLRNRIRQEVIPVLSQLNPNIVRVLSRQSDILRDETTYLDHVAENALESVLERNVGLGLLVNRTDFLRLPQPIRRRVIMKIFRMLKSGDQNPPYELVESLLGLIENKRSGCLLQYKGLEAVREYDFVRFTFHTRNYPLNSSEWDVPFLVPGSILWPVTSQRLTGTFDPPETFSPQNNPFLAYFDAEQFSHSLRVRSWKPGDVFYPLGLGGKRKKIQDFFSDIKLSRSSRTLVPLLTSPEGVLWIAGYRMDHRFRITDRTTRVLRVEISGG